MSSVEMADRIEDVGRLITLVEETGERVTIATDGPAVSVLLQRSR
ncbi:hypothetical protein [Streptomyces sp. NPDC017958]